MKVLSFCFLILISLQNVYAQFIKEKELSGSFSLGLSLRLTKGRTDYTESRTGVGLTGSAEYFLPLQSRSKLGLRLLFGGQNIYGYDERYNPRLMKSDMYVSGIGINYAYKFTRSFYPYVYLGISNIWFDPKYEEGSKAPNNKNNLYEKSATSNDLGWGLRYFISEVLAFHGEMQLHFLKTDYLDDVKSGDFNDVYISASFGINFTLNSSNDDDKDGVANKVDPCPDISEDFDGFEDEDGCPDRDNDKDGIVDENDACPSIPEDVDGFQDNDGCPDMDNDLDGVPDHRDQCPDEAEDFDGFQDQDGCIDPDNDNDGIIDSIDNCINAAEDMDNFNDDDGCPEPDNDNDGILDINDKCPDDPETRNGYNDKDGCPDKIPAPVESKQQEEIKQPEESKPEAVPEVRLDPLKKEYVIPTSRIFSAEHGSDLRSSNIPELDRIVKMLENDISSRWRIEVYMDSQGSANELTSISKKQADAVLQYFVSKGLPSFQFQSFGMGSRNPVSDNNTAEGRSKNRRVVLRKFR